MQVSASAQQKITLSITLIVSAAVGLAIFAYGLAVRDVCLGAGLGPASSNALALLACAPILAALYSFDF
jgi:hypothetical protein